MKGATLEQIKADVSIPSEFKKLLDTLEEEDVPIKLIEWASKVFKKGRAMKIQIDTIADCVIAWAEDRHFHYAYIRRVLIANGYREMAFAPRASRKPEELFTPRHYIVTFKNIVRNLSNLTEVQVMSIKTTRELIDKADKNLIQTTARMSYSELEESARQLRNMGALITAFEAKVQEKIRIVNQIQK